MTYRTYYRLSLLLPFVFPILFLPFTSHTSTINDYSVINLASIAGMYSWFAILYGGIPKDERQVHNIFYYLPLIFIPVFSICWVLFFVIMNGSFNLWSEGFFEGLWGFTYGFGLWILAIGYFYITLIQCGYFFLKRRGKIV
jgi:hypothetical protein